MLLAETATFLLHLRNIPRAAAAMIEVKNGQARSRPLQGCIKLKRDSFRERGGDSLSPQSLTRYAGDKLSPPRLSELDAALRPLNGSKS